MAETVTDQPQQAFTPKCGGLNAGSIADYPVMALTMAFSGHLNASNIVPPRTSRNVATFLCAKFRLVIVVSKTVPAELFDDAVPGGTYEHQLTNEKWNDNGVRLAGRIAAEQAATRPCPLLLLARASMPGSRLPIRPWGRHFSLTTGGDDESCGQHHNENADRYEFYEKLYGECRTSLVELWPATALAQEEKLRCRTRCFCHEA